MDFFDFEERLKKKRLSLSCFCVRPIRLFFLAHCSAAAKSQVVSATMSPSAMCKLLAEHNYVS